MNPVKRAAYLIAQFNVGPMNHFFSLIAHHEYVFIFAVVLAEALGLPVPAALALVAGGAAAAAGTISPIRAMAVALVAMLTGDT